MYLIERRGHSFLFFFVWKGWPFQFYLKYAEWSALKKGVFFFLWTYLPPNEKSLWCTFLRSMGLPSPTLFCLLLDMESRLISKNFVICCIEKFQPGWFDRKRIPMYIWSTSCKNYEETGWAGKHIVWSPWSSCCHRWNWKLTSFQGDKMRAVAGFSSNMIPCEENLVPFHL